MAEVSDWYSWDEQHLLFLENEVLNRVEQNFDSGQMTTILLGVLLVALS